MYSTSMQGFDSEMLGVIISIPQRLQSETTSALLAYTLTPLPIDFLPSEMLSKVKETFENLHLSTRSRALFSPLCFFSC